MSTPKPDYEVLAGKKICPRAELHDAEAEEHSYAGFSEWAKKKSKTHRQQQCPGCGLWKVWTPKEAAT